MLLNTCFLIVGLASWVSGRPNRLDTTYILRRNSAGKDAPLTAQASVVQNAISCKNNAIGKAPGGVVLLVHGTGSDGKTTWQASPYWLLLPTAGRTYDVCWVSLPMKSLGDAQLTAEYVVLAVKQLAPHSATKQVSIIGHSQGAGFNPQWALLFWPSIRNQVKNYIALSGDFKGTSKAGILCNSFTTEFFPVCEPALWQQKTGSNYILAQNVMSQGGGGHALVPTTSIYTVTDEILDDKQGQSSTLAGALMLSLQSPNLCGPDHAAAHNDMHSDPAVYAVALATLEKGSPVDANFKLNSTICAAASDDNLIESFNNETGGFIPDTTDDVNIDMSTVQNFFGITKSKAEPALQKYVCDFGFATNCKTTPGFD